MIRVTSLAAASLFALSTAAFAAPQLERVRGTVESMTDTSITVKTNDGKTQEVKLDPKTAFVWVEKSSLENIKDGKFIGTATKGENPPTALELVIFPDSMKGTAEGHYAWDSIPDQTAGGEPVKKSSMTNGTVKSTTGGGAMTKSAMTNGTVKSASGGAMTKSAMTNGTVKSGSSSGGGKMIDVTYDNGQSLKIEVPPSAPIVEFEKADKSIVTKGSHIFTVTAKDGSTLTSKLVAIGKDGLTPPM
jgi:hypothetical protein